jgi:hypothetical protein
MKIALFTVACAAVFSTAALAEPASAPMPANVASAPVVSALTTAQQDECCRLAAGALVDIELIDAVSSRHQKPGDKFALRLAAPIMVDGKVLLPAGAAGFGEVIDADPPGFGGRPGKLVLAARYVEQGGVRVPLRAFKLGMAGKDNTNVSMAVGVAIGIVGILVEGGDAEYPAGTRANAKVAADMTVAPASGSVPPPDTQPSTPNTQGLNP